MKIECVEHKVPKTTRWGTVQKSLNQHKVFIENDEKQMMHIGYVGVHDFLPLSGVPEELVEPVRKECERILERTLGAAAPPPSLRQIQEIIDAQKAGGSEPEPASEESEDDE